MNTPALQERLTSAVVFRALGAGTQYREPAEFDVRLSAFAVRDAKWRSRSTKLDALGSSVH